jgi:hypothetical protein
VKLALPSKGKSIGQIANIRRFSVDTFDQTSPPIKAKGKNAKHARLHQKAPSLKADLQTGKLSAPSVTVRLAGPFTARIHRSMPDALAPCDQTPLLRYHVTRGHAGSRSDAFLCLETSVGGENSSFPPEGRCGRTDGWFVFPLASGNTKCERVWTGFTKSCLSRFVALVRTRCLFPICLLWSSIPYLRRMESEL